jgi:hypothetical protein
VRRGEIQSSRHDTEGLDDTVTTLLATHHLLRHAAGLRLDEVDGHRFAQTSSVATPSASDAPP